MITHDSAEHILPGMGRRVGSRGPIRWFCCVERGSVPW